MISFEEAESIAKKRIPSDHSIVQMIEKPYGWYFYSQNNEYIKTKNHRYLEVGSGGYIVEKEKGEVVQFGSAYAVEKNFEIYEKGLCGRNDLVILKVRNLHETVRLLHKLQMSYIAPKIENGVEWRIPKPYNEKEIKQKISILPCVFKAQSFYFRFDEFQEIDKSKCFDYEIKKS